MVRKGEKGTKIVFASRFIPKAEQQAADNEGREAHTSFMYKMFTTFNIDQIDDLPDEMHTVSEPLPEREAVKIGDDLATLTGADIRHGGPKAFYTPSHDYVQMPNQIQYHEQINYYRTLFHELSHWIGHESRLDRTFKNAFGTQGYAREELVAELSAAFER